MTRKPSNVSWHAVSEEQRQILDAFDLNGNNGWARNPSSESRMPSLLAQAENAGLTVEDVKIAMSTVGYRPSALRMLDRWESKRTTGRFGK